MELKLYLISCRILPTLFESHLYGIETSNYSMLVERDDFV